LGLLEQIIIRRLGNFFL